MLLFDEPTSALDPTLVGEVISVMEGLAHEGATMIVVTHEMQFAREAADRVYFIQEGSFIEAGPPEQVLDAPKDERTQAFLARFLSAPSAGRRRRPDGRRRRSVAAPGRRSAQRGSGSSWISKTARARPMSPIAATTSPGARSGRSASRGPIAMRAMRRMT